MLKRLFLLGLTALAHIVSAQDRNCQAPGTCNFPMGCNDLDIKRTGSNGIIFPENHLKRSLVKQCLESLARPGELKILRIEGVSSGIKVRCSDYKLPAKGYQCVGMDDPKALKVIESFNNKRGVIEFLKRIPVNQGSVKNQIKENLRLIIGQINRGSANNLGGLLLIKKTLKDLLKSTRKNKKKSRLKKRIKDRIRSLQMGMISEVKNLQSDTFNTGRDERFRQAVKKNPGDSFVFGRKHFNRKMKKLVKQNDLSVLTTP